MPPELVASHTPANGVSVDTHEVLQPDKAPLSQVELARRADHLQQSCDDNGAFFGLNSPSTGYDQIAVDLHDLTATDAEALQGIYRERTGNDSQRIIRAELSAPAERYQALRVLSPDSIVPQLAPVAGN